MLTLLLEGGLFFVFGLSLMADVSNGVVLGTGKSTENKDIINPQHSLQKKNSILDSKVAEEKPQA